VIIAADVFRVVEIDEIEMPDLAVDGEDSEKQQYIDAPFARSIPLANRRGRLEFRR
jgi:hypothetical protein